MVTMHLLFGNVKEMFASFIIINEIAGQDN